MLVAGKNTDDACAEIARYSREFTHVLNLHFALGHFAMLQVSTEIVIACDDVASELSVLQLVTQTQACFGRIVEYGKVRPLSHQHDGREAKVRGFVDELIQG